MDTGKYVDTFELTRTGLEVSGQTSLLHCERLTEDLPEQDDSPVSWSLRGEKDSFGRSYLHLRVKACPMLECQRCLAPFAWPIDAENRLQMVNTEAGLEDDAVLVEGQPEDFIERIVGSPRLDVLALVEDEIILSLPYVPKHDVCPSVSPLIVQHDESDTDAGRPSPFAVLSQLKKN